MTATPPPEPAPEPDDDETCQLNVRVPKRLRRRIDARREALADPMSRDRWVAAALTWALAQPIPDRRTRRPSTDRQLIGRTPTGRSVRNPPRTMP